MARHDQKIDDRHMTCPNCVKGECKNCVDVARSVFTVNRICECKRANHEGEAFFVKDPFTGEVIGKDVTVMPDGTVKFKYERCDQCKQRHGIEGCPVT